MTKRDNKREQIARNFKRLRSLLGLTQRDLIARTQGILTRTEIGRVERGVSLVTTTAKRQVLATAYGLPLPVISQLVEGVLSPEDAAKLAVSAKEPVGFHDGASGATAVERGERMAHFVRLDHVRKSDFPGLECCLLYHEMSNRPFRKSTVEAARSGDFGADRTPAEWKTLLDRLDSLHSSIVGEEKSSEKT